MFMTTDVLANASLDAASAAVVPVPAADLRSDVLRTCRGTSSRGLGRHTATRARGFTMIELLVTVAVAAILLSVGLPELSLFVKNDRQVTELNTMVLGLNTARSEAVKQDQSVSVCSSATGAGCANTNAWSNGWIVLSSAANSVPLQVVASLPTNSNWYAGSTAQVTFLSSGMISSIAPIGFTLCDARGATNARYLQVAVTGRVTVSQKVGYNLSNNALVCQ